ncbi:MAG: LD-carboxypeptidase [Acidobacteriota bacterium]
MNRRDLLKSIAALPILTTAVFGKNSVTKNKIIKPKRLKSGDTVGLIAPAGYADDAEFQRAVQNLEGLDFKVKLGKNVRQRYLYLGGTDKERVEDIHWAFQDSEVKAVWCLRGGYGITRLLPDLNFSLIKKNPKIVIGYSDITALLVAIHQNTGLVTFHGPGGSSTYSDYTKNHVLNVLTNPSAPYKIELSENNKAREDQAYKTQTITKGKARGKLVGGNLTLLSVMNGTKFQLKDTKGKILFIEDVNEPPYKVDRMITQLRQAIDMRQLAGVACGIFTENNRRPAATETQPTPQTNEPPETTTIDVIKDRLGDLGIPVIYGLSFGHIREQFTLPIGIEAEFDTESATVTFLESGVI